jgi:hypothetical protein
MDGAMFLAGGSLLFAAIALSLFLASNAGDALTRNTIRLSLVWYFAALVTMLSLKSADWTAATLPGRIARWLWTWGVVAFLVHLAMAFHYFHGWSHTHAFEHTKSVSGWGEGLYVSYAFTLLWMTDAAWWWISPCSYAARGTALHWGLQAFLFFIAFNGAVVYESGPIRWAGMMATAALTFVAALAWRRKSAIPVSPT